MIKLENVVLASPEQMEFIVQGMRNPMNSWEKSDTCFYDESCVNCYNSQRNLCNKESFFRKDEKLGSNDHSLMQRLSNAGTEHRKYMRMMPVYVRITSGHAWWSEFDTYKIGTVRNSCSKMHKIHVMGFDLDSFDHEGIDEVGERAVSTFDTVRSTLLWLSNMFNETNKKKYWRAIIELLPMGFHLTANVELNYEVLANIYRQRKGHKLDEWREVCKWIESLPYSELITGLPIESDQAVEEKRFSQPFPWIKEDVVYCDNCEHFHDCLNKGGLTDVTISDDITEGRYIKKPRYDCPKEKE